MMTPMMNFFKAQTLEEEAVEAQITTETPEEHDSYLLCYSSLSDDNSESDASEEQQQRKVRKRQYSKLAQMVSRMGKEHDEGETSDSHVPVDIDLSTMNLTPGDDETCSQKKKVFDRRYSRLAFSVQQVGSEMKK